MNMDKNKIKNLKSLAETKFLSLYEVTYYNKKGGEKQWTVVSRKNKNDLENKYINGVEDKNDAVIIAAFHKDYKKLVAIKQFRVPINDYVYELPAGLVDSGENIMDTLERELREETGLKLVNVIDGLGGSNIYGSAGMTDESIALVYCNCEGEVSKDYLEDDEDIETLLLSREEAKILMNSGVKMDIKLLMTLQSFIKFGEKCFE